MSNNVSHSLVEQIFEGTSSSYDAVARAGTLGMDWWWKRRMMRLVPRDRPIRRILDLGCGTGILTFMLARGFPAANVVGVDLMAEHLRLAVRKQRRMRIENVEFFCMAAEDIGTLPGTFDLITGSYLPKYVDAQHLVRDCQSLTRPGGVLVLHDFTVPRHRLLRIGYRAYWMILRTVLAKSEAWEETAAHLDALISGSRWERAFLQALEKAEFTGITTEVQPLQVASVIRALRK